MLRKEANQIVCGRNSGGLSNPSKMPEKAFGLSASSCPQGCKLRCREGTVCSKCYARGGFYQYSGPKDAHRRREERLEDPRWVDAMVALLQGIEYFRWFDSGDIVSDTLADKIVSVVERTPDIKHWLATREINRITEAMHRRGYELGSLPNLTIRYSLPLIDPPVIPSKDRIGTPIASVHREVTTVTSRDPKVFLCHVYYEKKCFKSFKRRRHLPSCGECRACWDRQVQHVSYLMH